MLNAETSEELPCIPSLIRSITSLKSLISPQSDAIPAHSIFTLPPSTGRVYRQACLEAIREFSQGERNEGVIEKTESLGIAVNAKLRVRVVVISRPSALISFILLHQLLSPRPTRHHDSLEASFNSVASP
eukprot:GHVN01006080.1.p1 GENE.GHVN01006080.1~~GHVN01006080.1.p1  ORF type:complete len:130 (+),score=29.70 GHVN01006080.1:124-513(+)